MERLKIIIFDNSGPTTDTLVKRSTRQDLREKKKSLNIVIKHVFICSNPYIYTTVVQEVYNRDRSPEVYWDTFDCNRLTHSNVGVNPVVPLSLELPLERYRGQEMHTCPLDDGLE